MKEINDRIVHLIETEGYNFNSFSKKIGANPQTIHNISKLKKTKPSFDVLNKILIAFPEMDARWLMTGEGSYISRDRQKDLDFKERIRPLLSHYDDEINRLKERIERLEGFM